MSTIVVGGSEDTQLVWGGQMTPIESTHAYDFTEEWRERVRHGSSSSAHDQSRDQAHGTDQLPSLIESLVELSNRKAIRELVPLSADVCRILLFAAPEQLRTVPPDSTLQFLRAINSVKYLPQSLAFIRGTVRLLCATASEFSATEACDCLIALGINDSLYHRDITATLLYAVLCDTDALARVQLIDLAGMLPSLEHLLSRAEVRRFLEAAARAIDDQPQSKIELGLFITRVSAMLSCDQSPIAPSLCRYVSRTASEFSMLDLRVCLRYLARRDVAPFAEAAIASVTERLLRLVESQVAEGRVDLQLVIDALRLPATESFDTTLYGRLVHLVASVIEDGLGVADPSSSSMPKVNEQGVCPDCGTTLPWRGLAASLCLHQCTIKGVGQLSLATHIDALHLLSVHGLDPATSALSAVLFVWLANRLDPAAMHTQLRSEQRRQLAELAESWTASALVLRSGAIVLPTRLQASPGGLAESVAKPDEHARKAQAVVDGLVRVIRWQADEHRNRGAYRGTTGASAPDTEAGLGEGEFEYDPKRHLRPSGEPGLRFKLRTFAACLQITLPEILSGRTRGQGRSESAGARTNGGKDAGRRASRSGDSKGHRWRQ